MGNTVIGITGGIASGKSAVCQILQEKGFLVIDADRLGHEVLRSPMVISQIRIEFGNGVVKRDPSGEKVDRAALGRVVFSDEQKKKRLEGITHPLIIERIKEILLSGNTPIVLEAIALFRSGVAKYCDQVWLVKAPPEVQIERMMQTRGYSLEVAVERMRAQKKDNDWEGRKFDAVIDSSEPMDVMRKTVLSFIEKSL